MEQPVADRSNLKNEHQVKQNAAYAMLAKHSNKSWRGSDSRELAASFAFSVTAKSGPDDMVARRGSLSIFSAFCQLYPQVF